MRNQLWFECLEMRRLLTGGRDHIGSGEDKSDDIPVLELLSCGLRPRLH